MLSALLSHGFDIRSFPGAAPSALHVVTNAAGYEQRRNEVYNWDGLTRGSTPFLVIQHTLIGEGRLDYAGVKHRLTPGKTMLVTMPHAHRYWLERGGHWEYFWFLISGREALRMARAILEAAGPVLTPSEGAVEQMAAACLRLLSPPVPNAAEASAAGYAALCALHDAAFADAAAGIAPSPALARVLAHVERHLAADLHVDTLARVAGMSRAHFVRRFAAAYGVAPSDHVLARRMDRVERLLLATEMKVADIAKAAGFADPNYLAKAFRRHRGLSPLAFRATRDGAV
ncbi:MAG: AraC family transcriptional regulator [Rhodobacteraceae bacterium PARR1]|nr:MAG: AraC family transcriptional regulator [Rhodobacteraceae bacterium PARR1]